MRGHRSNQLNEEKTTYMNDIYPLQVTILRIALQQGPFRLKLAN